MATARDFVIGAGPAGLTAALEMTRLGRLPLVLEAGPRLGGLSRTEEYRGYRFDLGGHRFYTKDPEIQALWHDVMGPDLLRRPRLSRIYFKGRFFPYPLEAWPTLLGLGPVEMVQILASWARASLRRAEDRSFEDWVTRRFGRRLFETFFRAYTEKVWGVPCRELRAEWAAQRLRGMSMPALFGRVLLGRSSVRSLTGEFHYPRLGPGSLWEAFAGRVVARGGQVLTRHRVVAIRRRGARATSLLVRDAHTTREHQVSSLISTLPLRDLVSMLDPPAPRGVVEAARSLRYRSFVVVCLILEQTEVFPDNWIYIHDPGVRVARIQNFKNWSPDLVPDAATTSLGMEYFCDEGDALWRLPDEEFRRLAATELERIGLARPGSVRDGVVLRVPDAYPIYDAGWLRQRAELRQFVDGFDNVVSAGRNGLHRYDNQDHAMKAGLLAARNLFDGGGHDLWQLVDSGEYLESARTVQPRRDLIDALVSSPRKAVDGA